MLTAHALGADLRAKREELGWALPDVASWLRIRESYLRARRGGYGRLSGQCLCARFPA
nr:helix-turn-helix domain-containing protein [Asaia platycodi]